VNRRQRRCFASSSVRPATKYLNEHLHKRSLERDARGLQSLDSYVGNLPLSRIHQDSLGKYVQARLKAKISPGTINRDLAVVRRILILAARAWRDESGHTWLETAPLLRMLPHENARQPYPLSWEEQRPLFSELDGHLAHMALFKVNTGTREQEVVQLKWEWEVKLPEQEKSVFVIPARIVKNKADPSSYSMTSHNRSLSRCAESTARSCSPETATPSRGSTTRAGRRRDGALPNGMRKLLERPVLRASGSSGWCTISSTPLDGGSGLPG